MGRRCWKESQDMKYESQDMKYDENKSRKRRTAQKRNKLKLSEEHEEMAQNQKKQEIRRKSSILKNEEEAEDRKVQPCQVQKRKTAFPDNKGGKLRKDDTR